MNRLTLVTKPTKISDIQRAWHLVDVKDQILGRVATRIAALLTGKSKPNFVRHLDAGDFVVVINCRSVKVTGKKSTQKTYDRYSGYPGGRKIHSYLDVMTKHPEHIIREAVSGMLPHNKLQDKLLARLYIYPDDKHPYESKFKI